MKTKLALLSLILLAACGGGSDSSAATASKTDQVAQPQQPQQPQPKEEEKMEEKKDQSIDYFEYLDPYSDTYKPPYEVPSWDQNHAGMATHTLLYPFRSLSTLGLYASSTKTRWLKVRWPQT